MKENKYLDTDKGKKKERFIYFLYAMRLFQNLFSINSISVLNGQNHLIIILFPSIINMNLSKFACFGI